MSKDAQGVTPEPAHRLIDRTLSRRQVLASSIGLVAASTLPFTKVGRAAAMTDRPPIILVLADYPAAPDLSAYGCCDYPTPNIDRLANAAVRLIRRHEDNVACGEAFFTGGMANGSTLARRLAMQGHETIFIGNWPCGRHGAIAARAAGYARVYGDARTGLDQIAHNKGAARPLLVAINLTEEGDAKGTSSAKHTRMADGIVGELLASFPESTFVLSGNESGRWPAAWQNAGDAQIVGHTPLALVWSGLPSPAIPQNLILTDRDVVAALL